MHYYPIVQWVVPFQDSREDLCQSAIVFPVENTEHSMVNSLWQVCTTVLSSVLAPPRKMLSRLLASREVDWGVSVHVWPCYTLHSYRKTVSGRTHTSVGAHFSCHNWSGGTVAVKMSSDSVVSRWWLWGRYVDVEVVDKPMIQPMWLPVSRHNLPGVVPFHDNCHSAWTLNAANRGSNFVLHYLNNWDRLNLNIQYSDRGQDSLSYLGW
jgi:hypothetical protein